MVEIDVSAVLARDINKASDENLYRRPSLSSLPCKSGLQRGGNNVEISLFHFLGVSL